MGLVEIFGLEYDVDVLVVETTGMSGGPRVTKEFAHFQKAFLSGFDVPNQGPIRRQAVSYPRAQSVKTDKGK